MGLQELFPTFAKKADSRPRKPAEPGKRSLPAIGVDIGAGAVRAVRVTEIDANGYAVIDRFAVAPLKADAVDAGKIQQRQLIAAAVRKTLEVIGSTRNVIIGINTAEQAVVRLALPAAVRPSERMASIRANQPQLGPALQTVDADISLNYVRQEVGADGGEMSAVLAAGVRSEQLKTILEICRMAKIYPRAVDLSGAGTLRALVRDRSKSDEIQAIVDVGASSSTVIIRQGLHIRSIRTIPAGGAQLTRSLATALKEGPEGAERRKLHMALPTFETPVLGPSAGTPAGPALGFEGVLEAERDLEREQLAQRTQAERALVEAVDALIEQLATAIESDASMMGVPTPHVALCGGTALQRGFQKRLERRLRVEVRIGHPWARLAETKEHAQFIRDGRTDPRVMMSLATATGLALWRPMPS